MTLFLMRRLLKEYHHICINLSIFESNILLISIHLIRLCYCFDEKIETIVKLLQMNLLLILKSKKAASSVGEDDKGSHYIKIPLENNNIYYEIKRRSSSSHTYMPTLNIFLKRHRNILS
jgi:hypothetical protein